VLLLRCLLAAGYTGLTSYHLLQVRPLRIPLVGSWIFLWVNAGMAMLMVRDRYFLLGEDDAKVYSEHFEATMSVADFKTLMAQGETRVAAEQEVIVKRGEVADLAIILEGSAEVRFDRGRTTTIGVGGMAGEIGFVSGSPASATVTMAPGSRYVIWPREGLRRALAEEPALEKGLQLVIGRELMRKLAADVWFNDALKQELAPAE